MQKIGWKNKRKDIILFIELFKSILQVYQHYLKKYIFFRLVIIKLSNKVIGWLMIEK